MKWQSVFWWAQHRSHLLLVVQCEYPAVVWGGGNGVGCSSFPTTLTECVISWTDIYIAIIQQQCVVTMVDCRVVPVHMNIITVQQCNPYRYSSVCQLLGGRVVRMVHTLTSLSLPWWSTAIWSAPCMVLNLWAMTSTVRPVEREEGGRGRQQREGDDDDDMIWLHAESVPLFPYPGRLCPKPPVPVSLTVHQGHLWPRPRSAHEDSWGGP